MRGSWNRPAVIGDHQDGRLAIFIVRDDADLRLADRPKQRMGARLMAEPVPGGPTGFRKPKDGQTDGRLGVQRAGAMPGSLVGFLRGVVVEPVHIELVVVAETRLG